jgi:flagellar basal-body rod protein FlgB
MLNKLDAALSFHQTALRVRGQRQELIAANIANADTPNYKARDIDFNSVMRAAVNKNTSSIAPIAELSASKTSQGHFALTPSSFPSSMNNSSDVQFRSVIQGSADGNSVDMDVERNQFADNAIRYEASLTMINGQLKKMLAAIQGQ